MKFNGDLNGGERALCSNCGWIREIHAAYDSACPGPQEAWLVAVWKRKGFGRPIPQEANQMTDNIPEHLNAEERG